MKRIIIGLSGFLYLLALTYLLSELSHNSNPTATCIDPVPMPTGESWIPLVWESPLPDSVHPGESFELHFSDGYMLVPHSIVCGGSTEVSYPTLSAMRQVDIYLDDSLALSIHCARVCTLVFAIPRDFEPGLHNLRIGLYEEFQLRVE